MDTSCNITGFLKCNIGAQFILKISKGCKKHSFCGTTEMHVYYGGNVKLLGNDNNGQFFCMIWNSGDKCIGTYIFIHKN